MAHRRPGVATVTLLALLVGAVLLGGCAGKTASSVPGATAPPAAPLMQMTPAEKTSQIATSFPRQVPVAAGEVTRGEAQGDSAWVYEVVVPGSVNAVRRWYIKAYSNAEWTLTASDENATSLQKNAAQTRLQFEAVGGGSSPRTRVTAAVGVGTPVLQTQ